MINHLYFIFIGIHLYTLTKCSIVQTQRIENTKEICVGNQVQTVSTNDFKVCYLNDIQDHSILVWFHTGKSLNDTFDSYRFILRPIDDDLSSNIIIQILTNFTQLIDFHNSLRMFNLDSGKYEVCIEFQSNSSIFIYQPRDGCIPIELGKLSNGSFKQSSTPLLIALASSIVLFFILGLVVQHVKKKHRKRISDDDEDNNKPRSRKSSVHPTISLKQQPDHLIRHLFHRHFDQPRSSHIRQWARNHAFRHRISTQEHEFERPKLLESRSRIQTISHDKHPSSEPNLTTNNIYTISENEHQQIPFRKISFYLSTSENNQMT